MPMVKTPGELKDLLVEMRTHYGDLHKQFEDDEALYNLEFEDALRLPKRFRKDAVLLPTARDVVNSAVDHVAPSSRRVTVPRRTLSATGAAQSQTLQRFYEALLNYLERSATVAPFREFTRQISVYGIGVLKFYYDQTMTVKEPVRESGMNDADWKEYRNAYDIERKATMPFRCQVIHPAEVFPDPWNDPPSWVIQVSKSRVFQVEADYPSWENVSKRKPTAEVEVVEFWTNTHRAVMIDGASALKTSESDFLIAHKWGKHPFLIGDSGLGLDDSKHRPEARYVGMLRYIRSVLLSESRSFSIADIVLKSSAWPVRVAEGERANEVSAIKMEYGTTQPLPPGVKITNLSPDLPPEMLFSFLSMTNSIISSAAAPRVVRGLGQPGLSSGYDRQIALGEARLRYGSIAESVQSVMTELCQLAALYMENVVQGPVSIAAGATQDGFEDVTGRSFHGNHAVTVKVNVMEPEDEVRKHQDVASMVTTGLMSQQNGIVKVQPDVDPKTEIARMFAEKLLRSPEVGGLAGQAIIAKLAQNLSLRDVIKQILEQAQAAAAGGGAGFPGRRSPNPANAPEPAQGAGSRADQVQGRTLNLQETGGMQ